MLIINACLPIYNFSHLLHSISNPGNATFLNGHLSLIHFFIVLKRKLSNPVAISLALAHIS